MYLRRLLRALPFVLLFSEAPGEGGESAPPETTPEPAWPANTSPKDMTVEQRAAYHEHHARKHEDRVKQKNAEIEKLKEQIRQGLPADQRAIEEAREEGRLAALRDTAQERLRDVVTARLSGRVSDDQLAALLRGVPGDLVKDGAVDRDGAHAWADLIAPPQTTSTTSSTPPATGTPGKTGTGRPAVPPATPLGNRTENVVTSRRDDGVAEAARRFGAGAIAPAAPAAPATGPAPGGRPLLPPQ